MKTVLVTGSSGLIGSEAVGQMGNIHRIRSLHLSNKEEDDWEVACLRQKRYL